MLLMLRFFILEKGYESNMLQEILAKYKFFIHCSPLSKACICVMYVSEWMMNKDIKEEEMLIINRVIFF